MIMEKYFWTEHAKFKLKQYGLSQQRIKRVLRNPYRREEGIVKNTVAMMQPVSTRRVDGRETWKQEIWVMVQKGKVTKKERKNITSARDFLTGKALKVISAWRYPGVSPKNDPIPEEVLEELRSLI